MLRNGLITGVLFIACIVGVQVSFLLAQAGETLNEMELSTSGLLSRATQTLTLTQSTLEMQKGYYRDSASHIKALTKAAAIDAIKLGRLIEKLDELADGIADAATASIKAVGDSATAIADQTKRIGDGTAPLLQAAKEATEKAGDLAGDPGIQRSLTSLEASSENLQKTTAEAAEAMGYIRDMLSPTKKSFWRRLLELMIPRPSTFRKEPKTP